MAVGERDGKLASGFPEASAAPFCFQETAISLPSPSLSVFLGPVFSLLSNLAKGKKPCPSLPIFSSLA